MRYGGASGPRAAGLGVLDATEPPGPLLPRVGRRVCRGHGRRLATALGSGSPRSCLAHARRRLVVARKRLRGSRARSVREERPIVGCTRRSTRYKPPKAATTRRPARTSRNRWRPTSRTRGSWAGVAALDQMRQKASNGESNGARAGRVGSCPNRCCGGSCPVHCSSRLARSTANAAFDQPSALAATQNSVPPWTLIHIGSWRLGRNAPLPPAA